MQANTKPKAASSIPRSTDIRVLVVDDSAVIRGMNCRWLEEDPGITIAGSAPDGLAAVNFLRKHPGLVDIIILDVEMPKMDGLTALPKLVELEPKVKVIMASTLTQRDAEISIKALRMGAADYLAKPLAAGGPAAKEEFRRSLLEKVRALGAAMAGNQKKYVVKPAVRAATSRLAPVAARSVNIIALRAASLFSPSILAVASSTGGPQALFQFFKDLKDPLPVPTVVVQHMPPTFTAILAKHIEELTGIPCAEAVDGEVLQNGHVYVAPGDHHMTVVKERIGVRLALNQDPQENFCRPSADPLFRSLASVFGPRVLAVVFTGMGADGLAGGRVLVDAGSTIFAQDEESSVVWGMPGAVAQAGLCNKVLPLDNFGRAVVNFIGERQR